LVKSKESKKWAQMSKRGGREKIYYLKKKDETGEERRCRISRASQNRLGECYLIIARKKKWRDREKFEAYCVASLGTNFTVKGAIGELIPHHNIISHIQVGSYSSGTLLVDRLSISLASVPVCLSWAGRGRMATRAW